MIEIRILDGEVFIVSRTNRRENLLPPSEAIAEARTAITDAEVRLRQITSEQNDLHVQISEAVFFGEETSELRAKLDGVVRASESVRATIGRHRSNIEAIHTAVDRHHADALQRDHAAHLAALVAPFDKILKECQP